MGRSRLRVLRTLRALRSGKPRFARTLLAALLLAATGCAKCGAPAAPKDAGAVVRRAIDLRSAMIATLPEWRNIFIEDGRAVLRRELEGEFDARAAQKGFVANGYVLQADDAGVRGQRDRFVLWAGPGAVEWRMQLQPDDADHLIAAPNVMSTENMATWFPPGLGEEVRETFTLTIRYNTKPERVEFLSRQLYELSTRGTWKVLEGPLTNDGGLADHSRFVILDRASDARLTCTRDGEHVSLEYVLVTYERK